MAVQLVGSRRGEIYGATVMAALRRWLIGRAPTVEEVYLYRRLAICIQPSVAAAELSGGVIVE